MSAWRTYPDDYRSIEVSAIVNAVRAGECLSVVGLSGAGKSNLLGFLAARALELKSALFPGDDLGFILVDCNRLAGQEAVDFFRLVRNVLGDSDEVEDDMIAAASALEERLSSPAYRLCLMFDRFDSLDLQNQSGITGNLRALRDAHKYSLTFVTATRQMLDPSNELAELFYANTIWLGPLSERDARWTVAHYAGRKGLTWDEAVVKALIDLSWGYPSLLRAACEAYAGGAVLELPGLLEHPAVRRRIEEFWGDHPHEESLRRSGLCGQPLLMAGCPQEKHPIDYAGLHLTAKEHRLLQYFRQHPERVCEKDELVRGVWPEDKLYEQGIRDDSLAQLVRRLREKVEGDASSPNHILTVPGRGYRFLP